MRNIYHKESNSRLLFTSISSLRDTNTMLASCTRGILSLSQEPKEAKITGDPTFTGPPRPTPLFKVGEQYRLLQVRDPLHAGGTPASSRHVLELYCHVVCS